MSYPKILFLVGSYFQQRDYHRFGIENLQANGFDVEVWEVFRPWRKQYAESYSPPDPSNYKRIRHFFAINEILWELEREAPDTIVVIMIPHILQTAPIFRCLARRKLYFGPYQGIGYFPFSPASRHVRFRIPSDPLNSLYVRLPHWARRTIPPRYLLLCGGIALEPMMRIAPQADHIWSHALDYNLVLEAGGSAPGGRRHIVFLDEYVPFHPDDLEKGRRPPNSAAEYYPKLIHCFRKLESAMGLPVVIAAHPRSKYSEHPDYFEGRRIVQGQTCALVRDASLVITHSSISNSFTAVFQKPALCITTDGLARSVYGPFIESMADALGAPLINLDRPWNIEMEGILRVDQEKRTRYVTHIIKRPGTSEENTWQVFANHLKARMAGKSLKKGREDGDE